MSHTCRNIPSPCSTPDHIPKMLQYLGDLGLHISQIDNRVVDLNQNPSIPLNPRRPISLGIKGKGTSRRHRFRAEDEETLSLLLLAAQRQQVRESRVFDHLTCVVSDGARVCYDGA